ncbi:hypothetical protein F443_21438, partial [Phytophthora nicotianae P1569]
DRLVFTLLDYDCNAFKHAWGYLASGNCVISPEASPESSTSTVATLADDGSASVSYYDDNLCSETSLNASLSVSKTTLADHSCDNNGMK